MTQQETSTKFPLSHIIHMIVGLSIMLFARYLPSPTLIAEPSEKLLNMGFPLMDGGLLLSISPVGMTVITIFIGVIYLWTFVDTLWPGFLGVLLLGFSSYAPMNQVLNQFMGNPMTVLIFMFYIFGAALIRSNIAAYLAQWLMTRKIVDGRPWVLTAMILLTSYLVAFLDQISAVFLIWPAMYLIFKEVGFKKGDLYVSLMIVNSLIMILLSFATDPIKGGAFYLLSNLYSLAATSPELQVQPLNFAAYLFFGIIVSLICLLLLLVIMRFVYNVDVSPLSKVNLKVMRQNKLPAMTWKQRAILTLFLVYATWMLLPGIIGTNNFVGAFIRANLFGGSTLVVFLLTFIQFKGENIVDISKSNASYPWRVFFLIAVAFLLGGAMTSAGTNVSIFMEHTLRAWLTGLSFTTLTIVTIIIAIVVTNFCNSVVAGIIFAPVLLAICNVFGFNANPLLACFFFIVLIGAATPAASPFAAMLFENSDWINKKDAIHYSVVGSLVVVIVMIIFGLPLANMLF